MDLGGIIFIVSLAINFVTIAFILFFERSDSARRFSWLFAIAFIPFLGLLLYVLLSGNFFTRTKRMIAASARANEFYTRILSEQHRDLVKMIGSGANRAVDDYGSILHMNIVYGRSPILTPNTAYVFTSGEEKFRTLFAELEMAERTIHLSYFIINNDTMGRHLVEILARKARAGVTVRLLYDHVGSIRTPGIFFRPLLRAGGRVSRFFPVSPGNPFKINYRNHRKIVVIDGLAAYFGGMNIGDEYANLSPRHPYYWRDTHVRLTGPSVQLLQKQFLVDWYSATERDVALLDAERNRDFFPLDGQSLDESRLPLEAPRIFRNLPVQIVSAGPDDQRNDEIRDALILMISKAKKSVYIETPYFTPDEAFFTMLKIAALSGIDVRIIVPGNWDKWYVGVAAMGFIERLRSYGVRFFRYPGFIHAKMFVIDSVVASIGSTNVDNRSFSLHFELNAFFYSAGFGQHCADIFKEDEERSVEITADWFAKVSVWRRAWWNFMRLFSPIM